MKTNVYMYNVILYVACDILAVGTTCRSEHMPGRALYAENEMIINKKLKLFCIVIPGFF